MPPAGKAQLAAEEVEVWLVEHDLRCDAPEADGAVLCPDEIARAKLMSPIPRRRFVKTRAVLRRVLSAYTGVGAASIRFAYGARGKPRLVPERAIPGLHFSVSHASDRAIIAVGRSTLGVDIENRRAVRDVDGLASRFLAPREVQALRRVPAARREQAFLRLWTQKEAYAKALGEGIAMGFRSFDIAVKPSQGAVLLGRDGNPDRGWTIRDLIPEPGMVGSLAVSRPGCALWCWKLQA